MAELQVRWSEQEARKPYARPFGVTFLADDGTTLGSIAVSGADLLYHRQFQAAVLALSGEVFYHEAVSSAADSQRAWLDRIAALIPHVDEFSVAPRSSFDDRAGRVFHFGVLFDGQERCSVDAPTLLEYQEFQATLAHQTGRIYRDPEVEAIDDQNARQTAWIGVLRHRVGRPDPSEAMSEAWPWR